MIHIYHYQQTIILLNNISTTSNLEHHNMFNDKITLYKNMDNPIIFKIRNRDRVQQTISNVHLTILDSNRINIIQTYLDFTEDDKNYKIVIPKEIIANTNTEEQHYFMLHFTDSDNRIIPLYVDHDFTLHGILNIRESTTPVFTKELTFIEEITEKRIKGKGLDDLLFKIEPDDRVFYFQERFSVDEKTLSVQYTSTNHDPKILYVLKHKNRHYPISIESKQWSLFRTYHEVTDYQYIETLPKGHYMFMYISQHDHDVSNILMEYIE